MNPEGDQGRREQRIKLAVALGLAAILAVVVLIVVSQSGSSDEGSDASGELTGLEQTGTVLGDPSAPVTVFEYGDLQCPICRAFARQEVPQLIEGPVKAGEAKLDFQNWTIIGPDSKPAAEAALAAAEQNKMWDFILAFYDQQQAENSGYVTDEFLTGIAEDAGLDVEKWNTDRQNPAFAAQLKQIDAKATALGFTGTPSVTVEGPGGKFPFKGNSVPTAADIEAAIAKAQ
jgi:protein-disulfide isomerase